MGNTSAKGRKEKRIGDIVIELDDGIGLVAGEIVTGKVHVRLYLPFKAVNLTIGLHGQEFMQFTKQRDKHDSSSMKRYASDHEIVDIQHPLASWSS